MLKLLASLLIIAYVALLVSSVSAAAAKKVVVPPKSSWAFVNSTFSIGVNQYVCSQNVSKYARFSGCSDSSAVKFTTTIKLKSNQVKTAKQICATACLKKNVAGSSDGRRCVGYRQLAAKNCQLAECGAAATTAELPVYNAPKSNAKFIQQASYMDPSCFKPIPTLSPTRSPTNTEAPVPPCVDTFNLDKYSTHFSEFVEIKPDKSLCEMVKVKSGSAYRPIELTSFACSVEACVRRCYWDSNCRYAMYSAKLTYCALGTKMELTDDEENYKSWFDNGFRAFRRADQLGDLETPYFGGWCSQFTPDNCNKYAECHWNKGKRGYNVFQQGGTAGGYCGRIKCITTNNNKLT